MSKYIVSYRDYGTPGEVSAVTFNGADLTAANIVAQTADADALRLAMQELILGGVDKRQLVAWVNETKTAPASAYAQRENKWLVRYHDNVTTAKQTLEIPTADLTKLDPTSNDKILRTDADVIAFIAAFEAFVLSADGNPVTVDDILYVGRNS